MRCSTIYLLSSSSSFRRIFWKRTFFEGVPVWELWEVFPPNVYLGVKKMCKKFRELPTVGLDLLRVTVLTTPPKRAMDSPMVEWCYRIYSMVKTTWTSWMGFGPVEWSGWGLVVIPFGKWSSGKKNRTFSMDIAREICTDSFYTVNSGTPCVPLTAVIGNISVCETDI